MSVLWLCCVFFVAYLGFVFVESGEYDITEASGGQKVTFILKSAMCSFSEDYFCRICYYLSKVPTFLIFAGFYCMIFSVKLLS